jgi:hypothetical protein
MLRNVDWEIVIDVSKERSAFTVKVYESEYS